MKILETKGDHLLGYFILIRVGCNKFLKIFMETNEDIGDQWRPLFGIFIYKFLFLLKLFVDKFFVNIIWRPTETNIDIGDQWRPFIGFLFLFLN